MGSMPISDLSKAIENVQKAAQADTDGSGQAHVDLLEAIHQLNLTAETPSETLMRMRFQVWPVVHTRFSCHLASLFAKTVG